MLLTAPAGYGKTTLLAEWAAEDDRPFVWVRLVDGDNDPALFVASVIDALDEMKETLGEVPATLVTRRSVTRRSCFPAWRAPSAPGGGPSSSCSTTSMC